LKASLRIEKPVIGFASFRYHQAYTTEEGLIDFSHARDLSQDVLWLTDLNDQALEMACGGRARFKSESFFYRRIPTMLSDLGIRALPAKDWIQILHSVISWMFEACQHFITYQSDPLSLRYINLRSVPHDTDTLLKAVATMSTQRYCSLQAGKGVEPYHLYLNPADLYRSLSVTSLPVSDFSLVSSPLSSDKFLSDSQVVFVEISTDDALLLVRLAGFNFSVRVTDTGLWLSRPEWQMLATITGSQLMINRYITAATFRTLNTDFPIIERNATIQIKEQLAYSVSILYDSMIGSLIGIGEANVTLADAYIASEIRMRQVGAVQALQGAGISVHGYGAGRIQLAEDPTLLSAEQTTAMTTIAYQHKLMATVREIRIPFVEKKDDPFSTLLMMASSGDSHSFVKFNHYILDESH